MRCGCETTNNHARQFQTTNYNHPPYPQILPSNSHQHPQHTVQPEQVQYIHHQHQDDHASTLHYGTADHHGNLVFQSEVLRLLPCNTGVTVFHSSTGFIPKGSLHPTTSNLPSKHLRHKILGLDSFFTGILFFHGFIPWVHSCKNGWGMCSYLRETRAQFT